MTTKKNKNVVSLSPDPKILTAITHNPLPPINALCELIDNSIDGFAAARDAGIVIKEPTIRISLPNRRDIEEGTGKIVVEDNGMGLSIEDARKAVTAGYSGNKNPIDRLGLFGMGFNISTGKLGRRTVLTTYRKNDKAATSIIIDLPEMTRQGTFDVPVEVKPKTASQISGTRIEINEWWPHGDLNFGYISKLIQNKSKIRERIGRIYSTILKTDIKILIDDEECHEFHHCTWSEKRFVTRHNEKIPARINIDQSLGSERRCNKCWNLWDEDVDTCKKCKSGDIRIIEKRIWGWVGVQRFDDKDNFGIDLIRNGRAIRVFEKEAFFTWTDPATGERTTDYPIDNPFGRIVGEIHMDFVPVDYLKTDFQRTTPEWGDAIKLLRGETSLQPRRAAAASNNLNKSPVYRIYQGYRSVRDYGTNDMYMGYWDVVAKKPARISREIEKEYYEKFKTGEPGFFDDAEWWRLVEQAEQKPVEGIKECPKDGTQNPETAETCISCGYIFIGKACIKCKTEIPRSALKCPECGTDQIKEDGPWNCLNCGRSNPPEAIECRKCNKPKGASDVFNIENLKENSNRSDELSEDSLSIPLPGGESMHSIKLISYYLKAPYKLEKEGVRIPVCTKLTASEMHIFIDPTHPGISSFQDRPEDYIAMEVAKWILDSNAAKINDKNLPLWSLSNLYYTVHNSVWKNRIELNPQDTLSQINNFFTDLYGELPAILQDVAEDIYENCDERDQSAIKQELIRNNVNIANFDKLARSGEYLQYIPEHILVKVIEKYPGKFFDGKFWDDPYDSISIPDVKILEDIKRSIVRKYVVCLEDLTSYRSFRSPDSGYTQKVNQTLKIIKKNLVKA